MEQKRLKIVMLAFFIVCAYSTHTVPAYDILHEKMNQMLDKSGLRQKILDSQVKVPDGVVIQSPAAGVTLYSSPITVKGTALGKKIEYVEVRLDSALCAGTWKRASGTETWQCVFSDCSNKQYTIKARAYNVKGYSAESSRTVTIQDPGPMIHISHGPTNSTASNHIFRIALSADDNYGYWSTNRSAFKQFSSVTAETITIHTNALLRFYGKDALNNTSATQTREYSWGGTLGLAYTFNGNGYSVSRGDNILIDSLVIQANYNGFPVTSINDNSFYECNNLTNVIIPNTVTSIGANAFGTEWNGSCQSLKNIIIPNSVGTIGDGAFLRCGNLANLIIPDRVTNIGSSAFAWCGLSSISLSTNLNFISPGLLHNCWALTDIILPENITSIPNNAFQETPITHIIIPKGVTNIGYSAFGHCQGLTNITIPSNVISIGGDAFFDCRRFTSITIPDNVIAIGKEAFYLCESLTNILLPNGLTKIENYLFYACYMVKSIFIPSAVTSIGREAFQYTGLMNVRIPMNVVSISNAAFQWCKKLTNVEMMRTNAPFIGSDVFTGCSNTLKIHVPSATAMTNYKAEPSWSPYTNLLVTP